MTPQRLSDFFTLAVLSLTQPRNAMRSLLPLAKNQGVIILAAALIATLGAILILAVDIFATKPADAPKPPFEITVGQNILLLVFGIPITATVMWFVGRMFSGVAEFYDCLLGVTWHNFLTLLAMGASVLGAFISPALGAFIFLGATAFMIVQFVAITAEVHGFQNPFLVVLGIIGTYFAIAFVASIILTVLGVAPIQLPEPT